MVRSMYSGVSGMKAHQTKMDVIGNNISNVNTVGFKSSRATFKDIYYSSLRSATGSTVSQGGVNPSSVGYGATLSSIDVNQGRGTLTMTDRGLDAMIVGEGFYQVMDGEGNTFYTRAGNLSIDPSGNLVDNNGYFVLGVSGNPLGQSPASNKIQVSIPSVNPSAGEITATFNSQNFTFKATNATKESNVILNIASDPTLPLGQKVKAEVLTSGITIKLNSNEPFTSLLDLEQEINKAITEANGGKAHPAGNISISCPNAATLFGAGGLTGEEIASKDFDNIPGSITGLPANLFGGMAFDSTNGMFPGGTLTSMDCEKVAATATDPEHFLVTLVTSAGTFEGKIPANATGSGKLLLQDTASGSSLVFTHPGFTAMNAALEAQGGAGATDFDTVDLTTNPGVVITATTPSKSLGLSSTPIKLEGGTEGGSQSIEDCTSVSIGGDGVIEAVHPVHGRLQLGRIDLANFGNTQGLIQAGNSYFSATANSGTPSLCVPGTDGTGLLQSSALESSNVDLSAEFSDMIVTQRGFQANSRIITVSDTMLEELINLKR